MKISSSKIGENSDESDGKDGFYDEDINSDNSSDKEKPPMLKMKVEKVINNKKVNYE